MKRRELIRRFLALFFAGGAIGITGCRKRDETAGTPPVDQPPIETPPPYAENSPTPEVEATDTAPAEPPAPYGELTGGQQARVDAVMESLSEVSPNESKRWKENLSYDESGTERELRVWEAISDAYRRWNDERPGINEAAKQEAFNAILAGSLLPVGEALRYVKLASLTREDAKAAILLYEAPNIPEDVPSPEPSASPF